jgi:hypothetical protein
MPDLITMRYEHIYVDVIIFVSNCFFFFLNNIPVCYLFHLDGDRQPLLAPPPLERSLSSRRTLGRTGITRTNVHASYAYATDLFFFFLIFKLCV